MNAPDTDRRYSGIAVIVGATGGVGRALATELVARGYRLLLTGRDREALHSLEQEFGAQAAVLAVELTEPSERQQLFAVAPDVDLLVLAAGSATAGGFEAVDASELRANLALGVEAPAEICHYYGSRMAARGGGQILIFGSVASLRPAPGLALYGAAKAFLYSLGRSLAAEWSERGVTVTCCLPGPIKTGFAAKAGLARASYETSADEIARIALRAVDRRQSLVIAPIRTRLLYAGLSLVGERVRKWLARKQWRRRVRGGYAP